MEKLLTIAITVFDRLQFLQQAIESALRQDPPAKVIVVEDCSPSDAVRNFVLTRYEGEVTFYKNDHRRGLFDNWNRCLEICETPFLSILHDDDFLHPDFTKHIHTLMSVAPDCALYFGETEAVNSRGRVFGRMCPPIDVPWRNVTVLDFAHLNVVGFPGQVMRVSAAQAVGGFRSTSMYCGDVEMWVKLTAFSGAAQAGATVAYVRHHSGWNRGTSRVERSGKIHGLVLVQYKRVFALLREQGKMMPFCRKEILQRCQVSSRYLLNNGAYFSPRMLLYNCALLLQSRAPNVPYWVFQKAVGLIGPRFLKFSSCFLNSSKLLLGKCIR